MYVVKNECEIIFFFNKWKVISNNFFTVLFKNVYKLARLTAWNSNSISQDWIVLFRKDDTIAQYSKHILDCINAYLQHQFKSNIDLELFKDYCKKFSIQK